MAICECRRMRWATFGCTLSATRSELHVCRVFRSGMTRISPYFIKPRLRSAPPGALPGSGCARAPAFGPLGAAAADARPHVDKAGGHESITV